MNAGLQSAKSWIAQHYCQLQPSPSWPAATPPASRRHDTPRGARMAAKAASADEPDAAHAAHAAPAQPDAGQPRVYVHIGEPKTGTTFLQHAMWRNRAE